MRYLTVLMTMFCLAFSGEKHSTVTSEVKQNAKNLNFIVKVQPVPNKSLVMNYEGPWSLKIIDSKGLDVKVKENRLTLKDFDRTSQQFTFAANAIDKTKAGELKFEVTAFVCVEDKKTKQKTDCYRDVHAQNVKWTVN